MNSNRGKTTPGSTAGSYKPATGNRSRVGIPAAAGDDIATKASTYANAHAATGMDYCPHCRFGPADPAGIAAHLADAHPHLTTADDNDSELHKVVCPNCDGQGSGSGYNGQCGACRGSGEVTATTRDRLEQQQADREAAKTTAYAPMTYAMGRACAAGSIGWLLSNPPAKLVREYIADAANAYPDDQSLISFRALQHGHDPRGGSLREQTLMAACDTAFRFAREVQRDPAASDRARQIAEAITTIGPNRLVRKDRAVHSLVRRDMSAHAQEWSTSDHYEIRALSHVIATDPRGGRWADQVLSTVSSAVNALAHETSRQ